MSSESTTKSKKKPRILYGLAHDDSEIPHEPPFLAHLGNLSYALNDEDVPNFFGELDVLEIRLPRDSINFRLRGFGYVEFATRQDLLEGLTKNGQILRGRPVRITLGKNMGQTGKRVMVVSGRQGDPGQQDVTSADGLDRSDVTMPADKGDVDSFSKGEEQRCGRKLDKDKKLSKRKEPPLERKKLQLAPRTVPFTASPDESESTAASKIFGGAKPVDTASRDREIEEKLTKVAIKDVTDGSKRLNSPPVSSGRQNWKPLPFRKKSSRFKKLVESTQTDNLN